MKEEAGREERDNDKNVKPIQRNTNIRGLLKSPGLVERWMKQLPLDTGQRREIYVQMEVIYAQLLHKGSLFIANKWTHLMDLISIQILLCFKSSQGILSVA